MRRNGSQGHGRRTVTVLTIGNVAVQLKVPYVVARRSSKRARRQGQRGVARDANFYPFLAWLGIEEGLTPLVWTTVAKYGVLQASFETARDTLHAWGIMLSTKRIARLTYRFGQIGLNLRQRQLDQLKQGALPEGQILAGQRVVLSVDGGGHVCGMPKGDDAGLTDGMVTEHRTVNPSTAARCGCSGAAPVQCRWKLFARCTWPALASSTFSASPNIAWVCCPPNLP